MKADTICISEMTKNTSDSWHVYIYRARLTVQGECILENKPTQ